MSLLAYIWPQSLIKFDSNQLINILKQTISKPKLNIIKKPTLI